MVLSQVTGRASDLLQSAPIMSRVAFWGTWPKPGVNPGVNLKKF